MAAYLTVLNTRFNRSKVMKLLWLAFSLALLISPVKAQEQNDSAIRQLLSTTTTSSGQSIVLPKNNVQIVASIFDGLPSNASQAHNHPYPRYLDCSRAVSLKGHIRSQPDENNEADLRQDVDGHSAGEQAGSRSANPAS
jgi:hypothetical protein